MNALSIAGVRLIPDGDRIVSSVLGLEGKPPTPFEPESLKAWGKLCRKRGLMLDIGAYTGLYSLVAAKHGCRVLAFEPLKQNRARFRANALLNGCLDLDVNGEALADECGEMTITINLNVKGLTSGASLIKKTGANPHKRRVRTITVDSLHLRECTAMKIDVERAEPMVLVGAQDTLRRLKPTLLVEVLGDGEKARVLDAVPGYRTEAELDGRNWLMVPK